MPADPDPIAAPDAALLASIEAAVRQLHTAMADVANGDVRAIKALYSHTADATSFYGWGGYEKGWDKVSARWDWAGRQFQGGTVAYERVSLVASPEIFYVTEIETYRMRAMAGMSGPTGWTNRVTHIFRREDGVWRLVHRHGNRLEGQYEPGTRLEPTE
jgi:ketosteroid isomerase-like protein